jgi:hypothetical protein
MHDIKYFFSIKIIRQFSGTKQIFQGDILPKTLSKNIIFQNSEGAAPWTHMDLPLTTTDRVYHMNIRITIKKRHFH